MFNGGGDDVSAGAHRQQCLCHAKDGVVVGFGPAACKDNFLGAGVEERGHLFAGGFDGGAGALAKGVNRGGIAKVGGEIGEHGVEDGGLDGGGGVVIEVNASHTAINRILLAVNREEWPHSDARCSCKRGCKWGRKDLLEGEDDSPCAVKSY